MNNTHLYNKESWLAFHVANFQDYADSWNVRNSLSLPVIPKDEAAYGIFESAGYTWRYSNDIEILDTIKAFPADERSELALCACSHIQSSSLVAQVKELVSKEALSDEDIEKAETIVLLRDGLQAALDSLTYIVADLLEQDRSLLRETTRAICTASEVDDILLDRMDIITIATRIMEPFKEFIAVALDEPAYWWFYYAREDDEKEENIISDPETLVRSLGLLEAFFPKTAEPEHFDALHSMSIPAGAELEMSYSMDSCSLSRSAAASHDENYSLVTVWKKQVNSLVKILAAKDHLEALDLENAFVCDDMVRKGKNAYMRWQLEEDHFIHEPKQVAVVDTLTGKIIGEAVYNPKNSIITLKKADWNVFAEYKDNYEKLLLIILDPHA